MPTPHFPVGASAVVALNSQWRTFAHYSDNRIHQLVLYDPKTLVYADSLVGGPTPMPNSPVAAITWGSTLRVYYFTEDCKVQEMYWVGGVDAWFKVGNVLGDVVDGSFLYAQVHANGNDLEEIRVGYLSPEHCDTITESVFTYPTGWGTRTYAIDMMD
ncbi:hypothetical protein AZE42_00701 [Rhizopogon vesiculosus]|uniref:Fucose-specific lectin n=1 Tax=Rhizopogon vesiculosus TaxID=180088 RepID=A0A1J8PKW1_9AGAM|nr:hypothetical protein AZE42_00701 [Rhizopogon vesiculosus]